MTIGWVAQSMTDVDAAQRALRRLGLGVGARALDVVEDGRDAALRGGAALGGPVLGMAEPEVDVRVDEARQHDEAVRVELVL